MFAPHWCETLLRRCVGVGAHKSVWIFRLLEHVLKELRRSYLGYCVFVRHTAIGLRPSFFAPTGCKRVASYYKYKFSRPSRRLHALQVIGLDPLPYL